MNEETFHTWIEWYSIEFDALIGLPISKTGPGAELIKQGKLKEITHDEAKALNESAIAADESIRRHIATKLAVRWQIIEHQQRKT